MKAFYEDNCVTLYDGDARAVLQTFPEASVHCVVCSPPYWGLRSYKDEPQVWGGDPDCQHDWGDEQVTNGPAGRQGATSQRPGRANVVEQIHRNRSQGQFCTLCSAWRGCLGLEPTIEMYLEHIVEVFRAVKRVLRRDGTLWLNLGDSYSIATNVVRQQSKPDPAKPASWTHRADSTRMRAPGLKAKDLCMIPARVALALQMPHLECLGCGAVHHELRWGRFPNGRKICPACEKSKGVKITEQGWWLRSDIIWSKPNPMPESCTDRPTSAHEHLFLFALSGTSTYWTHRDKAGTRKQPKADYRWVNKKTGEEYQKIDPDEWLDKDDWRRINLWRGHDYFYDADAVREPHKGIAYEGKAGLSTEGYDESKWEDRSDGLSRPPMTMQNREYNPAGRNLRSVWEIATQPFPEAHFATYPERLVSRCVLAGTSEKGCCPECGAPWERVVDVKYVKSPVHGKGSTVGRHFKTDDNQWDGAGLPRVNKETETLGWRPTCECGLEPEPCRVLDPFVGSGTTLVVAKGLNRLGIGIDVQPKYLEMAKGRILATQQPLPLEV